MPRNPDIIRPIGLDCGMLTFGSTLFAIFVPHSASASDNRLMLFIVCVFLFLVKGEDKPPPIPNGYKGLQQQSGLYVGAAELVVPGVKSVMSFGANVPLT